MSSPNMNPVMLQQLKQIRGVFVDAGRSMPLSIITQLAKLDPAVFKEYITRLVRADKYAPKLYAYSAQYFFKSLEWLPSITEFILFATFIGIVYVIVEILHNNYINTKVTQRSRCSRANASQNSTVTVIDSSGNQLYTVEYDKDKQSAAKITCVGSGSGDTTNVYNVNVYDYATKGPVTKTQTCTNQTFTATGGTPTTASANMFYSGTQGIVDFMTTNNPVYFTVPPAS